MGGGRLRNTTPSSIVGTTIEQHTIWKIKAPIAILRGYPVPQALSRDNITFLELSQHAKSLYHTTSGTIPIADHANTLGELNKNLIVPILGNI